MGDVASREKILVHRRAECDLGLTLRRYRAYGQDLANRFDGRCFQKVIDLEDGPHLLELIQRGETIVLRVWPAPQDSQQFARAEAIAGHILGFKFSLLAFRRFAESDPVLSRLCRMFPGLRPTLTPDPFEMLVTSITAQQINLSFACKVRSRIVRKYGRKLEHNGEVFYAFPQPWELARLQPEDLRKFQLTARKSEYIIELARAVTDGRLDLAAMEAWPDERVVSELIHYRGIGRWTVDWLLARGWGRGNAFPAGDLGVRKAMQRYYFNGQAVSEADIRQFAARWGDLANLTVHYLLTALGSGVSL